MKAKNGLALWDNHPSIDVFDQGVYKDTLKHDMGVSLSHRFLESVLVRREGTGHANGSDGNTVDRSFWIYSTSRNGAAMNQAALIVSCGKRCAISQFII
jgi:hypothetical protein